MALDYKFPMKTPLCFRCLYGTVLEAAGRPGMVLVAGNGSGIIWKYKQLYEDIQFYIKFSPSLRNHVPSSFPPAPAEGGSLDTCFGLPLFHNFS